jgi:hypothetical protein
VSQIKPPYGTMVNPARPSAASMLWAWVLNENTGAVGHDSTTNGNDAAIVGSPAWVAGAWGPALQFPGTNASIWKAIAGLAYPFSIFMSFTPTSLAVASYMAKIGGWANWLYITTAPQWDMNGAGHSVAPAIGVQQFLTWTWDAAGNGNLYVNNTPLTFTAAALTSTEVILGNYDKDGGGLPVNGNLDLVYGWAKELTAPEVAVTVTNPFDPYVYPGGVPLGFLARRS